MKENGLRAHATPRDTSLYLWDLCRQSKRRKEPATGGGGVVVVWSGLAVSLPLVSRSPGLLPFVFGL